VASAGTESTIKSAKAFLYSASIMTLVSVSLELHEFSDGL
jgi:hypothetical protein